MGTTGPVAGWDKMPSGLIMRDVELTQGQVQEMHDRIRAAGGWCAPSEMIYQKDGHEDCRFWNLTRLQCARHHMRLAEMHVRRTKIIADRTITFTTRSSRVMYVLLALLVGLAILSILF